MGYRDRLYADYESGLTPAKLSDLRPRAPTLRDLIKRHFPLDKNARIIDLGCGYGALLHFAREAGYCNVAGIDRSPRQIESAVRLGIPGVQRGDLMEALEKMSIGSLDVVVAFDVVEHFTKDELLPFIDRVFRVLKPHGRLIVHTVNGDSPMGRSVYYGDFTHETCFTQLSIRQLLKAGGFSEVRCHEDGPIAHGVTSAVRWVLWQAIRSILRAATAAETGDVGRGAIMTRNFLTVAIK